MKKTHQNNKKVCFELLEQLSEYIDGRLSANLCDDIEAHLQDCHNCSVVVDTLRKTVQLYQRSSAEDKMPEDMRTMLSQIISVDDTLDLEEFGFSM